MSLVLWVFVGLAAAPAAPRMYRAYPRAVGYVTAVIPAALTAYFLSQLRYVAGGASVEASLAWAPGVRLAFHLDGLSLFFSLLVCAVATLVLAYSSPYMHGEQHAGRFYSFMLMFVSAMLGLVLADDVITLYVFFELTSLSSFLLIGLEADGPAKRAARQALIVTSAGGLALLAGVLLLSDASGTGSISELMQRGDVVRGAPAYAAIVVLFTAAALTKSAQIPFHFWLPNAMVAPTPVSAFLHSAAMVKAGVYLLARFSPVLGGTLLWETLITAAGAVTMLAAAWLALCEVDLKRLLAYSTAMALGMMIMLLGLGGEEAVKACLIYVVAHACYKAALFMTTGAAQRAAGVHTIDRLGGLRRRMPLVFAAALLAAFSMAGFLPFIGALGKEHLYGVFVDQAGTVSDLLTAAAVLANIALAAAAGVAALEPFLGSETHPARHEAPRGLWFAPGLLGLTGLAFGLFPNLLAEPLLARATSAVAGHPVDVHLETWSGFTPEFWLSLFTVSVGIAVFLALPRLRSTSPFRLLSALGRSAEAAYDLASRTVGHGSAAVTGWLENGKLSRYLLLTFVTAGALVSAALLSDATGVPAIDVSDVRVHEWLLAASILLAAFAALRVRSRLGIILMLSTVSYGIALFYLLLGAHDVAMTQVLVETLLTLFVVMAFVDLPKLRTESSRGRQLRDACFAGLVGLGVTAGILMIVQQPFDNPIGEYYALNAYVQAHGRNVVNVILMDYRALDTLGEITVLGVAGLGSYALLRFRHRRPRSSRKRPEPDTEDVP